MHSIDQAKEVLKQYWGFEDFRVHQTPIIEAVLQKKNGLAILPTGGGKSLCYQVPALVQEGLCIVISPLIALMRDQVDTLRKKNIVAYAIFSGMPAVEVDRILDNCVYGQVKLLYVSPERLATPIFQERYKKMKISFIAIDEAHCISQWGHDFRPAYRHIAAHLVEQKPQIFAFTATATPEVQADIKESLGITVAETYKGDLIRTNLAYVVRKTGDKLTATRNILDKVSGPAIVYVRNRRRTKDFALRLRDMKISAVYYHAGLSPEDRQKMQEHWFEGKSRVMVCTNAFGMGIDKGDVRTVIHIDVPDSPEAYFQEAGRAGRDGEPAYAVVLYADEDIELITEQLKKKYPTIKTVKRVYSAMGSYLQLATGSGLNEHFSFDIGDFCRKFDLDILETIGAIKFLEMQGYIEVQEHAFRQSSFQIIQTKEAVYAYQIAHKKMDGLLNAMLRLHDGAFHQLVQVKEKQLAEFLQISKESLRKKLLLLQQEGMIEYHPRQDKPQLSFPMARLAAEQLHFDTNSIKQLEKAATHRVKSMIQYLLIKECRTSYMKYYLGESANSDCGVCDNCIAKKHRANRSEQYKQLENELISLLQKNKKGVTIDALKLKFPGSHTYTLLRDVVKDLMDEHWVTYKGGKLYWND